jgi:5-methylthioadenosine/S-adenosylhomocysteine deaminase
VALQSHYGTPWHIRNVTTIEDLLRMATLGGAEALGMEGQVGSIEPGKKADIVLARTRHLDVQPVYDPLFTAARGITGRDVDTVIVDGEIVVERGTLTTLDEPELRARLAERWPRRS